MKPNPYVGRAFYAFDTETHLIQPGLGAPPLVCGSWATDEDEGIELARETVASFRKALEGSCVLTGHNLAYDIGVMCAADPSLIPLVFDKYDRDEVYDTMIAESLTLIAEGTLKENGSSSSGGGMSLADLTVKYVGREHGEAAFAAKHGPDAWRLRYAELDGVPLSEWPPEAIAYPIHDARNTYDVAMAQMAEDLAARERGELGGRNLHDLPAQCRAHLALHLMSLWGVRTDPEWVAPFVEKVTAEHERTRAKYLALGLLKVVPCKKKKDGTLETPDDISIEALDKAIALAKAAEEAIEPRKGIEPETWAAAQQTRKDLERAKVKVLSGEKPMRYGGNKKALEAWVVRAYDGDPPRGQPTAAMKKQAVAEGLEPIGNVKQNKDALKESGDEVLIQFAADQDNEKFFSTYLSVLQQGTRAPINARYNVLVATGRTSCGKPNMQNLPRGNKAGNPREGFIARPGTFWSSNDYPTLELRTLAFALESLGFESKMAAALRQGIDLHALLASQILGWELEDFLEALNDPAHAENKKAADFRQMAKAGNFGLPGGLGATKLVIYARDSYGARFCILAGRATECGREKFRDKRAKVVVCKACRDVAVSLKEMWFKAWPEMNAYFELVKRWTSTHTMVIEDDDGDEKEVDVGFVLQLISERVRGGCRFTDGANTVFQGLAADIAKRALWLVSREAYARPESPLYGHRPVVFVHDEIITEHPAGEVTGGAWRVAELMDQAFHEFCPTIPCKTEPAAMERWFKKAEKVEASDGTLLPWEPKKKAA